MYVYLLRSIQFPNQKYIGLTTDLKRRLREHQTGQNFHTRKYRPWKISVALWFEEENKAVKFEQYLKTGSGLSFRKRHF